MILSPSLLLIFVFSEWRPSRQMGWIGLFSLDGRPWQWVANQTISGDNWFPGEGDLDDDKPCQAAELKVDMNNGVAKWRSLTCDKLTGFVCQRHQTTCALPPPIPGAVFTVTTGYCNETYSCCSLESEIQYNCIHDGFYLSNNFTGHTECANGAFVPHPGAQSVECLGKFYK